MGTISGGGWQSAEVGGRNVHFLAGISPFVNNIEGCSMDEPNYEIEMEWFSPPRV